MSCILHRALVSTVGRQVESKVQPAAEIDEAVLRHALVIVVDVLEGASEFRIGLDEHRLRHVEGLIQTACEPGIETQVDLAAPLTTVGVEPPAYVPQAQVEADIAGAGGVQTDTGP